MGYDVSALLARMREDFVAELPERYDRLEAGVLALERDAPDAFDELFRQVHSLKGAGGTFGLPMITTICHQFESFISEAKGDFHRKAASFALKYVDLLRRASCDAAKKDDSRLVIAQDLEQLRLSSMRASASVLLVDPSASMRKLYQNWMSPLSLRIVSLTHGLHALERLLQEPFDLLVASRELPDLNALAIVAALREAGGRNRNIPVILISGNRTLPPARLHISVTIPRDGQLEATLVKHVHEITSQKSTA